MYDDIVMSRVLIIILIASQLMFIFVCVMIPSGNQTWLA